VRLARHRPAFLRVLDQVETEHRELAPPGPVSFELAADDAWVKRGYGQASIEPGEQPAVLVIDLQYAFTDPEFDFGGAELIERATVNTARLLEVARAADAPVFQTVVAWEGERDIGLWPIKLPATARITPDSRWAKVDKRVWTDTDVLLPKKWPSFYHGTPLHSLLTAAECDTVIVTGCTTSGCVRATTVDSFSNGFRTLVPEDCVGDHGHDAHLSNLRDVHRRYAEVTSSDEVISYLAELRQPTEAAL
jgi:maleamate amidohydrolase